MWPESEVSSSSALAMTPSNFHFASGVAPANASRFLALSQAVASAGIISGQARVDGMNSVKRPGRKDGV
jgi:hypothetical protein